MTESIMRSLILLGTASLALVGVAVAQTPARTPAQLIQARQAGYKQILAAFKGLNGQVRAPEPSLPAIRQHSAVLARLAPRVGGWFPAGTGPDTGVRTRAKAEIWSDRATFRTRSVNFVVAARRLHAAARANDLAAVRAALPGVGGSCRECHDQFRGPEN